MVLAGAILLYEKLDIFTLDGRKMIFQDGSRLRILPSGTETKTWIYVEASDLDETELFLKRAKSMLAEIELLT